MLKTKNITKIIRPIHLLGFFLIAFVILFSGCNSAHGDFDNNEDNEYITLNFIDTETRANIGSNGSGSFSEGDRVGLYIDNGSDIQYRELSFTNGEWQPRLKRQDFGEGRLTLSAHYPVVSGVLDVAKDKYNFSVALDQSGSGKDASDLLFSQSVLEANQYQADMIFNHVMHRLRIELSGQTSGVNVAVRSRVGGTVNLLTGAATLTDDSFQWITPAKNSDGSYSAVIYPQEAAPYRDGDGSLLKVTTSDKEYPFKAPDMKTDGSDLISFEAGKQITVKLSLKAGADLDWANKKVWVDGIQMPSQSDWKLLYPGLYTSYFLPWKEGYGWYDCNKLNPTANPDGIPDGMMCWAASASSILHWWFEQNKVYIDMYGDKYKGPNYHYPQPKAQESDIFQYFIDAYADEAGYPDAGLNWFIQGTIPTLPHIEDDQYPGGFFKDVFPSGMKLSNNFGGLGKEYFNSLIKDALSNKKAVSLAIGEVRKGHIITLWGAEFNEEGNVSYIYVADNNDGDQFTTFGYKEMCMRYEVVHNTYPEGGTNTCYKQGYISYDKPIVINRLITMELGTQYWKEYFGL